MEYDVTFDLNEFGKPRICSNIETIKNALLFILTTKPGQYPSLPMIGLEIENLLYSFYDEIDEKEIENQIVQQCKHLGVFFQNSTIMIKKIKYHDQPSLLINIQGIEDFPLSYMTDKKGNEVRYMIGITFDELGKMLFNINKEDVI